MSDVSDVSAHEHLLAPGRIGALELRNRMVMAPMGEDLGDLDGMVSDAQMAYLEARARGGLAMVMLGSVAVSFPVGCSNARADRDLRRPPRRRLAGGGASRAPSRRRPSPCS